MARALAEAAERLKAARTGGVGESPPDALTADDALGVLRTVCTELRDTDLQVRRARARIAALSVGATVRRVAPEAPPEAA